MALSTSSTHWNGYSRWNAYSTWLNSGTVAIELSLTSTAEIVLWDTSYSGAYTRAIAMDVDDFEAVTKVSGVNIEAFDGAREVTNLQTYSQDITNAAWIKSNSTAVAANQVRITSAGGQLFGILATVEGQEYTLSYTAKILDSGGTLTGYHFTHANSASGNATTLVLSETEYRYSVTVLGKVGDGDVYWGVKDLNASDWANIQITNFQAEKVTGQTDQGPSNHILTTTASVTKYYNTENNNAAAIQIVKKRIYGNYADGGCAIGDSQTDNVASFSLLLNAVLDSTVTNEGVGGNTLTQIETRFLADADPANQSFVIIQGGVNDLISSVPFATMQTQILSMVSMCTTNSCIPIFINVSPWKDQASWDTTKQTATENYNAWLTSYCTTNGYTVIDAYTLLGDATTPEELNSIYDTGDHLHWNDGADIVLGIALYDVFALTSTSTEIDLTNTIGMYFAPATPSDYHFTNTNLISATKGSIYIEFEALPDYATADGTILLTNGSCEIRCEDSVSGISFNDGTNNTNGSVGVPSGVTKAVMAWSGTSVSITTANGTTTGTYDGSFGNATIYLGRNVAAQNYPGIIKNIKFYYKKALGRIEAESLIT